MDLLIQVNINQLDEYSTLFETHHSLQIEVTDFAYPQNYGLQGEKIVEQWQNSTYVDRIEGIHGSYFDLILHSIDPQIAEISRKRYLWNLGIADQLNAKYCIFHSNFQSEHNSRNYIKNWLDVHSRFIEKYDNTYDSAIILENLRDPNPHLLATLSKLIEVKYCLDIGYIQGYSVESFETWFEVLAHDVEIIHLKDINHPGDELPLGTGKIDWNRVAELVRKYCMEAKLVLEVTGLKAIEQSITLLEKLNLLD